MEGELLAMVTQFGVAGLIGWMWLSERRAGAARERELGVRDAELAELDQHLRLGIGGCARVDEHGTARAGRQHDG